MILADSIAHSPAAMFGPPRFGEWFLPAQPGHLPVNKKMPRPLADIFRKAEQSAAPFDRQRWNSPIAGIGRRVSSSMMPSSWVASRSPGLAWRVCRASIRQAVSCSRAINVSRTLGASRNCWTRSPSCWRRVCVRGDSQTARSSHRTPLRPAALAAYNARSALWMSSPAPSEARSCATPTLTVK